MLVAAFEGWNDAGDAASGAARWLADRYGAELVATIDAEDFFDFTTTRPIVEMVDDGPAPHHLARHRAVVGRHRRTAPT